MNVLIVDDEAIFRTYMRQALDWEAYGFRITGEARNGEEAMELAAAQQPDIALVDINMPLMDGLELTERMKKAYPSMDVILVSGHNEFEYARSALRLGVEDYILKPFSKDELALTLLKCRQRHQQSLQAKQTEKADRRLTAESLLYRLVTGETNEPEEQLLSKLSGYGIHLGERVSVACLEIDHMERKWNEPAERGLWKYAVTNILQETIEEEGEPFLFAGPQGRIVCLRSGAHGHEMQGAVPRLDGYEKVCRHIRKYLKMTVTIGVGSYYAGPGGIRKSYVESLDALRQKFTLGEDRVIRYDRVNSHKNGPFALPADLNDKLGHLLRMGEWEPLEQQLDGMFRSMREQRLPLDLLYVACMGSVSVCLSHVTEAGHPIEDCFGEHFFPYTDIRTLETLEAMNMWLKELFQRSLLYVQGHKQTRASVIASSARQQIENQYGNPDLSVEGIAGALYINPSYLRAVFKKAYGMSASEYLIHVRMSRAKELIGSSIRLSEVAERVGFTDPSYFSRSFRKFFGITPSEYEIARKSGRN